MKKTNMPVPARRWLALPIVALLASCGGGSDDGSSPSTGTQQTQALKLSGTAATGAAMAGASIAITCAGGNGSTTSTSNGSYTLSLTGGSLPCVITATSADKATVLHSVAAGSGTGEATSNVTPLSELLVAQLAGTDPAAYVAAFSGSTTISSDAVASAQTAVLQLLTAAGVSVTAVDNILSGTVDAGSGSGYDGVLDALQTTITNAGSSLTELTTAVATSSAAGSATGGSTVTTVLASANSDCPALKSGVHRVLDFGVLTNYVATIDASALTATIGSSHYKLTRNASCDYTLDDAGATRVLVSKSGIAVWLQGTGADSSLRFSFPDQKLDLASLAGVYNRATYSGASSDEGDFGTFTLNAAGVNTTSTNCPTGYGSCAVDTKTPFGHLVVDADGGFDYIDDGEGGVQTARVFAFRNAAGNTVLFAMDTDGTLTVLGAQSALSLPSVGASNAFWQFTVNGGALSSVSEDGNTVTAVDTATGAVTRQFTSDGHFDVISFNSPFNGSRYRAVNACTTSAGAASTCNATAQFPLPGTGLVFSVSAAASKHFLNVSINKP